VELIELEEKASGLAIAPARAALGATMAYHGISKLTPKGIEQQAGAFEKMGFKPGKPFVAGLGALELAAGISTIFGIGTRLAALAIIGSQAVAIAKVHAPKGFAMTKGGFEFNLALIAIAAGMLIAGPGDAALAHVLERKAIGRSRSRMIARRRRPMLMRAIEWLR